MNEIMIGFNQVDMGDKGKKVSIFVVDKPEENLMYKFLVGFDGSWETLKDFDTKESVDWAPSQNGNCIIMVQAKKKDSAKPFDYVTRVDYTVGKNGERIINDVYVDKKILNVGEKIKVTVEAASSSVMYKYWIKEGENWALIKDYSVENELEFTVRNSGKQELRIECKEIDSNNNFDDFKEIQFEVKPIDKLEITNFKALNEDMLVDTELIFHVDAIYQDNRMILYKFIKISQDGSSECIQDYSTKRMVSFVENKSGSYKILCMAKDMYSQRGYDDRAVINYIVKPYKNILIKSFISDLSSPQITSTDITLTAIVNGGKDLLYRFIIDGNQPEDSGFTRSNTYIWKSKKPGQYKIELRVKDSSYEGNYETKESISFIIDELSKEPVNINDIIVDKGKKILLNDTANINVLAEGGTELRYSFVVRKDSIELEKIDYGSCSWVNFTPEDVGNYEIDLLVKDKYSSREYDGHSYVYIDALEYMPASIEHILLPAEGYYMVKDEITLEVITLNTSKTLVKYVMNINGHKVEETDFVKDKKYVFNPQCSGIYTIDIYAKNAASKEQFDCKRTAKIMIHDSLPITNTKVKCDKTRIERNNDVTFTASCDGGKEVLYQFFLMEKGDWSLVQKYSRKEYYTFMPFSKGLFKILVLTKSEHKKCEYEDYNLLEFTVE